MDVNTDALRAGQEVYAVGPAGQYAGWVDPGTYGVAAGPGSTHVAGADLLLQVEEGFIAAANADLMYSAVYQVVFEENLDGRTRAQLRAYKLSNLFNQYQISPVHVMPSEDGFLTIPMTEPFGAPPGGTGPSVTSPDVYTTRYGGP